MIGREKRVLLRHYLEQGMNKAAIARELGISRRTVYHWIRTNQLDRELDNERVAYGPRRPMPSKLDRYKPLIDARLKEYPKLAAVRLFKEIRAAGYRGSYNQVKRYVRRVRPRPPEEAVVRFETPPGRQGQVDFAHFRLPWGKRSALIVVLGYSRLLWVQFYAQQTMRTLMRGLESSFSYFGGVPRELLFDQMKAVVIEDGREEDGPLIENSEFIRYANHWHFRIRACRPYRAQTKGKVERPIRYLRESFFYGRTFTSDDDLNAQVLHWIETEANVRTHGTLKERPVDRFERERLLLEPLAARPYHSLILSPERAARQPRQAPASVPAIHVERRPLVTYAQIAGGSR
jgi:transposase